MKTDKTWNAYSRKKIPKEVFIQQQAGRLFSEKSPYRILGVLGWYVYDIYYVIVTEYDEEFKDLYNCSLQHE